MATFKATYTQVTVRSGGQAIQPVMDGKGATRLTDLTTSGTSQIVQSGGSDFEAPFAGYITMFANGAVNVQIAASPTAAATAGFALQSGERLELAVEAGDKIAVIDA